MTTLAELPHTLQDFQLVDIDTITIGDRYRKNPEKNLDQLAESIDTIGLLNPVVLTSERVLVAGHRRLLAVQKLGYEQVEAHIVRDLDELGQLQGEHDENMCRENFTLAEAAALAKSVAELLAPAAKEASEANLQKGRGRTESTSNNPESTPESTPADEESQPPRERTREAAAKGTGYSGKTLERYNHIKDTADDDTQPAEIHEIAETLLAQVDASEKGVAPAAEELKTALDALEVGKEHRGQKKALAAAVTAIYKQAAALEAAFLTDDLDPVENFDADVDIDSVRESFKNIKTIMARITKVAAAVGSIGK